MVIVLVNQHFTAMLFFFTLLIIAVIVWQSADSVGGAARWVSLDASQAVGAEAARLSVFAKLFRLLALVLVAAAVVVYLDVRKNKNDEQARLQALYSAKYDPAALWKGPDPAGINALDNAELVSYGRDLIVHTQDYYGKNGILRPGTINALNCQNCHLDAGSRPWGNNYSAVQSMYPQFRERSGTEETIAKRVNDCFIRSLNGQEIDTTSREMRAIKAYIAWLGQGVPAKEKPKGAGLLAPAYLDRPADPERGRAVFMAKCQSCHGADGQGLPIPESARDYPPLWGENSYAESAGLFRLSRLAGFVKANMPFGATWDNPQLSDEECWDVAAFINSQPRPKHKFLDKDFKKIAGKPIDHPFGPFADTFPEIQHKFGPFQPIADAKKNAKK